MNDALYALQQAARVAPRFAPGAPHLSQDGRWRIETFTVSATAAQADFMRAQIRGARHGGVGSDRWTPEGIYVKLLRRSAAIEGNRAESEWEVLMSDTKNEIEDCNAALEHAHGRVLVHGLGLGCIIAALLEKSDVEHIDVVEIDEDLIRLVGPYYNDPRVTIHCGDCVTYPWPENVRWDYIWHDIWATISSDNLKDETAEYGISYRKLQRLFEDRCDRQDFWAFDEALASAERQVEEDELIEEFRGEWETMAFEQRLDLLLEKSLNTPGLVGGVTAAEARKFLEQAGGDQLERYERFARLDTLSPLEARLALNLVD